MRFKLSLSVAWCAGVLLVIAVGWKLVLADPVNPDIDIGNGMCHAQPQLPQITYGAHPGQNMATDPMPDGVNIGVTGVSGNVFWELGSAGGCTGGLTALTCGPNGSNTDPVFSVTQLDSGSGVDPTTTNGKVQIRNTRTLMDSDVGRTGTFTAAAKAVAGPPKCTWQYTVHVVAKSAIGGWGDPHMTTVDGVNYDFQGAGEFTALKKDKFEIQTRQRPVPSAGVGGVNEHTQLATCVSIYTGVALRIGSNQVSLVPNLSGQPDPSGLQLWVNHKLVTLTDSGIDLRAGGSSDSKADLEGRIVKAAGGAYEFDTADGMQVVATPDYWTSQQTWYLNLSVYQASATSGIWGLIPSGSWLPALPDGTSLGSKPSKPEQRYQVLYGKFADAWRVTDATSLFDYAQAPVTNTASFTVADWPRFNPTSCAIQGQPTAMPADPQVAAQACSGITDPAQKANCTFDVTVTGNTGFAETYTRTQAFRPHGAGWQPVLGGVGPPPPPPPAKWPWWWWIVIVILVLIVIAVLIARKKKTT